MLVSGSLKMRSPSPAQTMNSPKRSSLLNFAALMGLFLVPLAGCAMGPEQCAGCLALLVGDALCTYAVTTGNRGPQIAPFSADVSAIALTPSAIYVVESDATIVAPLIFAWVLGQ